MQSVYNRGDTVDIAAENQVRNSVTGLYADADADAGYPRVTVTDAGGVARVEAQPMDRNTAGRYGFSYALAADAAAGQWTVLIVTRNGGWLNRKYLSFRVLA